MSLDQTKAYVLTAASSSISDLMTAIYDHFNTAPGLWRLKPGTSSSAQGVVIEPKTPVSGYNIGVSIRRNSNTNFQLALDPLNAYTAAGNASVGPVGGSSEASGDITLAITGIASAKIALIETPDAIAALFFNSGLTTCPQALHIGRVFDPKLEIMRSEPLLSNGLAVLAGPPQMNQSQGWGMGTSGVSRVRHNRGWRPIAWAGIPNNNPIPNAPSADRELLLPVAADAYNAANTLPMRALESRYLRVAAASRTSRVLVESTDQDEAWMHFADGSFNTSASVNVITWEKGVAKPT
jgi:hypothetical protein